LSSRSAFNTESHDLRIIFLSRISKEKNLNYAINILRGLKLNILFDIYGPIEDPTLWDSCLEKIKTLPANIIVNYKGIINREDVKKTFIQYDIFFFPTIGENFGHVIVESLLVGTPVLISDRTPWKNLEVDGLGWDLSLDNPNLFIEAIYKMAFNNGALKNRGEIVKSFTNRLKDPAIYLANKQLFTQSFKPKK
jgi:glycosyltransferase involved in cell wall biosynthesis